MLKEITQTLSFNYSEKPIIKVEHTIVCDESIIVIYRAWPDAKKASLGFTTPPQRICSFDTTSRRISWDQFANS